MRWNDDYQRQLADCLIGELGLEGARDFARRSAWEGVLAHILPRDDERVLIGKHPKNENANGDGAH